jgi:hypothetical protein
VDTRLAGVCSVAQAPLLMLVKAIMLFDFWKVLDEDGVSEWVPHSQMPRPQKNALHAAAKKYRRDIIKL